MARTVGSGVIICIFLLNLPVIASVPVRSVETDRLYSLNPSPIDVVSRSVVLDSIRDTLDAYQYYYFVQYFDSSRVVFQFGEVKVTGNDGQSYSRGLINFDPILNAPMYDNSLTGLYSASGTRGMRMFPGDVISFFKVMFVEAENAGFGSRYIGIQDTVAFYLELVDLTNMTPIDTIGYWGILPSDSMSTISRFSSMDTSIVQEFVMPDYGLSDSTILGIKIRPMFVGSSDRLSISRWDIVKGYMQSERFIEAKAHFNAWFISILDSLTKRSSESNSNGVDDFYVAPTSTRSSTVIHVPAGSRVSNVSLYNSVGSRIQSFPQNDSEVERMIAINVGGLRPGMYFLVCSDKDGDFLFSAKLEIK